MPNNNINIKSKLKEMDQEQCDISLYDFASYSSDYYISDIITELADSNISIYTRDLLEWAVENYNYIDDAIFTFGSCTDFLGFIRQGQYYYYTEYINDNISDYILYYVLNYLLSQNVEELTSDQYDDLVHELKGADQCDTLSDVEIIVDNLLEEWDLSDNTAL